MSILITLGSVALNAGIVETEIDGQRRFLLPAHRNTLQKDPLGSRDHMILSSTSLLEWRLEAFIPQPERGKVFLHEGDLAPGDAAGELKIVMRTAAGTEGGRGARHGRSRTCTTRKKQTSILRPFSENVGFAEHGLDRHGSVAS